MKKINKYKIVSIMFSSLMLGTLMLFAIFNINSNKISNNTYSIESSSLFQNDNRVLSTNLKVLNIGDYLDDSVEPGKNLVIKEVYSRKPSQITPVEIGSIVDIINTNIPSFGNDAPVYINLSGHPTNSTLTNDDPLECFTGTNANLLTPNYLDKNGILAFKASMYESNVQIVEYYLVSGFNSKIILTTLPGAVYQYSVADLTDSDLETFITFSSPNAPNGYVLPNKKSLVANSRVQVPSDGTISFSLTLTYDVINATFATTEDPTSITIAQYNIETKFDTNLSYSGFQPSGNLSSKKLYELIGFILVISIAIILIITSVIFITKKIKFKKSL